eukprot:TRINITY_DN65227_c0_g2_i1.p2 TRINITY_DN65227_c0_g2~~TRINITY_DN65227_c0_g2_i1.p2  ORF type:complete len:171 (-),score=64.15 TRINITY_DN65227_c0_g2_i1:93-605(-)
MLKKKLDSLNTQFMILNFTPEVKTMIDIFSANHKNTINISIKNENGCVEYGEDSCDDDESISGSDSEEGEDIKKYAILKEECYDSCSEEEEAKPKPKKEKKLKKKEIPTSSKGLSSAKKMEEEIALRVSSLAKSKCCLLYTSDAADDTPCVDLGGRRIIKKKKNMKRNNK